MDVFTLLRSESEGMRVAFTSEGARVVKDGPELRHSS